MTKKDIITLITSKTGVETRETLTVIEAFISIVKSSVKTGKSITLRHFGTFRHVHRKQKQGRHIAAGTQVTIPARNVVKFVPSKRHFRIDPPAQ